MNDGDLVRAVQRADRAALTLLYQRYVNGVWRYFSAHLSRDRQTAEDLVSETFLAAVRAIGTCDPAQGTVYGWMLGIARNKLRDHLRKSRREADREQFRPDSAVDAAAAAPDRALLTAEIKDAVLRALDALEDDQRLVLEWKYLEALSVREIAQRLGRTEKAVEAVLYRARLSFRAAYAREQSRAQ